MKTIFEKLNRFFVGNWQIAVLDLRAGRWFVDPKARCIPYLKAENAKGRHILIRPSPETEPYYLMADDLTWQLLQRHHKCTDGKWKPGRMIVETSPINYQVWIHSTRKLRLCEKRYWLQKLHSDPGAAPNRRWGRCPGFRNRKEQYRDVNGGYPLAKLVWIDWLGNADIPKLDNEIKEIPSVFSPQPKGGVCHKQDISRNNYDRGNESATDFSYVMAMLRRNFTDREIINRIVRERTNWKNHKGSKRISAYIERTISKAKMIVFNS